MALTGSTQPKRYGAGVYSGSGVNAGGQSGRSNAVMNGIGKQGGATARASQPKPAAGWTAPVAATSARPAQPANSHGAYAGPKQTAADPYRRVMRNGKSVLVRLSQLRPGDVHPGGAVTAPAGPGGVAGGAAPPAYDIHDSDYYTGLANEQAGLESALNPFQSELAKLRANVGGKTLYDTMFDRANSGFMDAVSRSRDDASKRGLLRSGAYDKQAAQLGQDWTAQQDELTNTYGSGRINTLEQQIAQQKAAFAQQQQALEMAAAARARERLAAANQSIYGQTIVPKGS